MEHPNYNVHLEAPLMGFAPPVLPALSELNRKINSASLSCLAGCSKSLRELVVCPVLWKGQWQVLPTLPGLTRLCLVHCRCDSGGREGRRHTGRLEAFSRGAHPLCCA